MKKSVCIAAILLLSMVGSAIAVIPTPNDNASVTIRGQASIDKSINWLKSQQKSDGGWQKENEPPAMTALVLRAMLQSGKLDAQTPEIKKGFDKLLSYQLDNGGIFKDLLGTYNTAIAITRGPATMADSSTPPATTAKAWPASTPMPPAAACFAATAR